jgi:hypothetical protein
MMGQRPSRATEFRMSIACPHCAAANPDNSAFCVSCGKALPSITQAGPRVLGASDFAGSRAGQELQAQDLQKKMKTAFGILLTLGILQMVLGGLILAAGIVMSGSGNHSSASSSQSGLPMDPTALIGVGVVVGVLGLLFLGLAIWARFAPFPAAIVGLVLYCSIWALDIIMDPTMAFKGIIITILIIGALAKAVAAGAQYRALRKQMQAQA